MCAGLKNITQTQIFDAVFSGCRNNPGKRRGREMKNDEKIHLCATCSKDFPTCDAKKIVFGIDRDPSARGKDADIILECDAYKHEATK